ncbi:lysophospholipase [Shewanella eurypsychrophilus]|uniref:Lysophospholipase n=1 Tax=Shewanella eurypsychrophilus TaxID=2593656 RepID=A0ABX6VGF4_9GAMM|nr:MULTISPECIES: alpha/beta fold hydrolase [Shewanella]QFU24209.1 alpha/beta fold hydrolase [Shewanella sp. YLB-09]QPG59414.1 lysophospholipase [Shewanella eurypsychrophilus]
MNKVIKKVLFSVLLSMGGYLVIAMSLTLFGVSSSEPDEADTSDKQAGINFSEMLIDYSQMPPLQSYGTRGEGQLQYRYYSSDSDKVLILLHGSGWHSQQFYPLAKFISEQGLAQVYTPDLRGHGVNPKRRGDIDYIGQFEDDLTDLIIGIKQDSPGSSIIMGGHSSGGGLAIRFAGGTHGQLADAYLLLAPFVYYNASTTRPNAGGWAKPYTARIIGLSMLNNIGIHGLNHLISIEFNMPPEVRNGTETLAYSYRLNTSFAPRDYGKDLSALTQPLLLLAGSKDETMFADKYQGLITKHAVNSQKTQVKVLPGLSHMGIVVSPDVRPVIKEWLEGL